MIRSSAWTGRKTTEEQLQIVQAFAPEAIRAAEHLVEAIRDRRRNDPENHDAIEALLELRDAIDQLISEAGRGPVAQATWAAYERSREKLTSIAGIGATLAAAVPVAIGFAHLLSWLSSVSVGETLISSVYASVIGSATFASSKLTPPKGE